MNTDNTKNLDQEISITNEHKIHKFVKHSISIEERENYYSQKLLRKITRYHCICGEMQEFAREPGHIDLVFDVFYSETANDTFILNKEETTYQG